MSEKNFKDLEKELVRAYESLSKKKPNHLLLKILEIRNGKLIQLNSSFNIAYNGTKMSDNFIQYTKDLEYAYSLSLP